MTAETDTRDQALTIAALLERWADEVPMWTAGWNEPWYEFSERRYEAEKALEAKLRRLPSCELRIDPQGTVVELSLGGIRVISRACLAGACRAWAAEVRRRACRSQRRHPPECASRKIWFSAKHASVSYAHG